MPDTTAPRARGRPARQKIVGNRPPLDIDAAAKRLPRLNPAVVDAIMHKLQQDQGMLRPPEQTARFLALVVALHAKHEPFPHREVAAQALGGAQSKWSVDTAIRSSLADGYVSLVVETTQGNVQRRDSVRKERHFVPDRNLVDIVERATRKLGT